VAEHAGLVKRGELTELQKAGDVELCWARARAHRAADVVIRGTTTSRRR